MSDEHMICLNRLRDLHRGAGLAGLSSLFAHSVANPLEVILYIPEFAAGRGKTSFNRFAQIGGSFALEPGHPATNRVQRVRIAIAKFGHLIDLAVRTHCYSIGIDATE